MTRKTAQTPVFFDIGKDDFDRLTSQAIESLRFGGFHPGSVGLNQVFVFATLHTATILFARCTLLTKRAGLTGLGIAAIRRHHDFTPTTAHLLMAPSPLEQLTCRAYIGV